MTRARCCVLLIAVALATQASAQTRTLTIDDLYDPLKRVDFTGGAPSGLTWISDTHDLWPKPARATFSPGFAHFLDNWSDVNTPPQVRVNKGDGTEVRLLHESKIPQLAEFKLSTPELLQVKARDGFVMEAMMIKPPDFNPARKYPVMQFTYGGPRASVVTNAWDGRMRMYWQLVAERGVIHGAIDENVHAQNTLKFSYELQKAGKPFRLMLYEKSRHGVTDPDLVKHMQQMMLDFTTETLLKPATPRPTTDVR